LWLVIFVKVPIAKLKATNHRTTPERAAVFSGTTPPTTEQQPNIGTAPLAYMPKLTFSKLLREN